MENEEQVELSFVRTWDFSLEGKYVPLNIDKRSVLKPDLTYLDPIVNQINSLVLSVHRFVMLRGSSGFYSYAIYDHLAEWPPFEIGETRITFKLRKDK